MYYNNNCGVTSCNICPEYFFLDTGWLFLQCDIPFCETLLKLAELLLQFKFLGRKEGVHLKLLSDLGSIQEQPGAETVHWTKVSCKDTKQIHVYSFLMRAFTCKTLGNSNLG